MIGNIKIVEIFSCSRMNWENYFPAFGNFTGKYILEPTKEDEVFVLVDDEVIAVS